MAVEEFLIECEVRVTTEQGLDEAIYLLKSAIETKDAQVVEAMGESRRNSITLKMNSIKRI